MSEHSEPALTQDVAGRVCAQHRRAPGHPLRRAEGGRRLSGVLRDPQPTQPLVSIITVVRNGATTLAQCMASVFAQSYDNIEYIVIDGHSSDGTLAIIQDAAARLDYYISEPDNGIYDAMNKGLALAFGDYVLLLNADDWYRSDAVARLVAAAQDSGADVTHANAAIIDAQGNRVTTWHAWLHDGLYTGNCPLRHETMLIRQNVYERTGCYDASFEIIADYAYIMRLYETGSSFCHVPEALLFFRRTGISNGPRARLDAERARLFAVRFPFLDAADLALLNNPDLDSSLRLTLIDKHRGRNELFTRSLAFNIAQAPEVRIGATFVSLVRRCKKQSWWPLTAPLRRCLRRIRDGSWG